MRAPMLRRALIACGLAATVSLSVVIHRSASAASTELRPVASGRYAAVFSGNGAEGRDMIWTGPATGGAPGEMTIRLAHDGAAMDMSQPTWDVEGIVIVSGDAEHSFAAEVEGMIDWRRGKMELRGTVSVGPMRGAAFEQTADIDDLDVSGQWRAAQRVAMK